MGHQGGSGLHVSVSGRDLACKRAILQIKTSVCLLSETGSRGRPVCLHLHSGPSHLDQPAVLGSHILQRSPESDQSPVSEHSRAENGPRCQDKGKTQKCIIESTT